MTAPTRPLLAIMTAAALLGSSAQAQTPARPLRDGKTIFQDKCVYCHDAKGWATRALAKRTPPGEAMITARKTLPAAYTKVVVRRGIGSMPGFTPTDLSDAEIAIIAAWLDKSAK